MALVLLKVELKLTFVAPRLKLMLPRRSLLSLLLTHLEPLPPHRPNPTLFALLCVVVLLAPSDSLGAALLAIMPISPGSVPSGSYSTYLFHCLSHFSASYSTCWREMDLPFSRAFILSLEFHFDVTSLRWPFISGLRSFHAFLIHIKLHMVLMTFASDLHIVF